MKGTFIYVIRGGLTLGIAYLEYPRCIMWLQPEEFGHGFQWIDTDVSIKNHNRVKLLLEMKEVELEYNGNKGIPMVEYSSLLGFTSPKP
ncbi:MAG: hypothetical protein ABJH08_10780 [Balneola sp.]